MKYDDNLCPVPPGTEDEPESPEVFQLKCQISMLQERAEWTYNMLERARTYLEGDLYSSVHEMKWLSDLAKGFPGEVKK